MDPTPERPPRPDLDGAEFRRHGRRVVEWIADYLENAERHPVLSRLRPGDLRRALPEEAPAKGEDLGAILDDFERLVVPAATHWNHPAFFGYFATSAPAPGVIGEMLCAALNQQAMLWRTSPAATELEEVALGWLRRLIGLPEGFEGVIYDTASIGTLHALAAAREASGLDVRRRGMAGRADLPRLRVYASEEAHSSVDKAAILLGLGQESLRKVPTDDAFRMRADLLAEAIEEDRAAGWRPLAIVATVGTTSTTSVDPVPAIAAIGERERLWLHVDAAYAGAAGAVPEWRGMLEGCDRADSLVLNPHKWLFVPFDCSALYCRRMDAVRAAFSLTPEYLRTAERARNLMDTGVQLGRRFRALKLWMTLRAFGAEGIAERLREHGRLARLFASWVDGDPGFERLAPVPFSVVCFRAKPAGVSEEGALDALNGRLLDAVNASGEAFLSSTRIRGRLALRLAIGHVRTEERHVARAWDLLRSSLARSVRDGGAG
ncbi:MAG TPA: pyridoxal-dependent decarboxylase [Planctomycetota bacterium]|nr:pyridoxal-dependent decarboxylase [Planctomycetota bacterium]